MTNADKFRHLFGIYATELWTMPESDFLEWLNADAQDTPTVDAVPVVRCKDCEHWKREENQVGEIGEDYFCAFDCNKSYRDDFFCADGERREDASKTD